MAAGDLDPSIDYRMPHYTTQNARTGYAPPNDYYTGINAAAKTVLLGTDEDLARAAEYARRVQEIVGGIEPEFCLNHGVATSLYYADPDQNLVELQVDIFGNWDASAEWMRKSEDFRQNPVGAFFDPDRVLAAHKAGATFEQLQKDTYARKYPPTKPPNEHVPSRR